MTYNRSKFGTVTSQPRFVAREFSVTTAGLSLGGDNLNSGVRIKADSDNAEDVFVGGSGVTASAGYVLGSDEEVFIDVDSLSKVFVLSTGGGETLSYIGS
jgi:hypothetical protein|tara:strand:+ start:328 stop:627 length:300 start_codon:yes stop_codon:yes gene_type:complete